MPFHHSCIKVPPAGVEPAKDPDTEPGAYSDSATEAYKEAACAEFSGQAALPFDGSSKKAYLRHCFIGVCSHAKMTLLQGSRRER